jgi:4-amino-4-deoxy-L-arabinose transferase-like glycosyltransferase
MAETPPQNSRRQTLVNIILPALVALIFLGVVFLFYPFREKLQFDTDEGLNLMRAMLVTLGHPLYTQVSSDQPPLLTQLLAVLFRVTGFNVNSARLLILMFSTLLVWSSAQFLQLTWGSLATLVLPFLVLMLPRYLELNVSVMIGVPSIALGMLALLFLTLWHLQRRPFWLVLSGLALGLSILTKLFTGFLAPIFLIGLVAGEYLYNREQGFSWRWFRPAVIWGTTFALCTLLLGLLLVGIQNVPQLIQSHLSASSLGSLQGDQYTINYQLQAALPFLLLGLVGVFFTFRTRRWLTLYILAWAVAAYLLLAVYRPVWYHHQLLITIPAALLGAAAVGESVRWLVSLPASRELISSRTLLSVIGLTAFIWVTAGALPVARQQLNTRPQLSGFVLTATAGKLEIFRTMNEYAPQTHWVVTDMPMYAFRIQRPVPPDLATFSLKRLGSGELSEAEIMADMHAYQPEQVLMGRFEIPALEAYLKENYTLIRSEEDLRLFLRNDQ